MDAAQQRAVLTICLMAAFADGGNDDRERAHIKQIAGSLGGESSVDVAAVYQDVLLKKPDLAVLAAALTATEQKQFAYEMAVGVCNADGATSAQEREFLSGPGTALGSPAVPAQQFTQAADAVANAPLRARHSTARSSRPSRPTTPSSTR